MPVYVNKYMDFYAVVYNAISETTQNYNYHNWKWNISIKFLWFNSVKT